MSEKPYTPETLAERWGCSSEKVRQMYHRGQLKAFRLGKLIRIPAIEVQRYECQFLTSSSPTEENSRSPMAPAQAAFAARLGRMTAA